jgi:hypothetical protein
MRVKFKLLWVANFSAVLLVFLLANCNFQQTKDEKVLVDFNFHIRPILSDKCFACHGPDANKREAGLRLDTREGAFAALKDESDQFAIVPGDKEKSAVWHRISNEDPSEVMPPPEFNVQLTEEEKSLIGQWIEQGAEYKDHWAFIPPEKRALPEVDNANWPIDEIDYYVLANMESKGLQPNPEAEEYHLLKRVALDLTGLPPSLDLQQRFLSDRENMSYEEVVDELLASPHYGEKMALHWLDVARYADSHGYQDDGVRTMWPWRDWVIHAFNQNYPYDQFVTWQLAGDLIEKPTKESILATGFNRNHKITQEGGVIDEEYRVEYVTDRTNTFGKAFLGLTFECAKCHDHKYDPISQEEYFSTFAFFNHVPEKGLFGTIDASFADPPNMKITPEEANGILSFVNLQDSMPVEVMIMQDSMGLRSTYVLERGNYDSHGVEVDFNTPKAIAPFDPNRFEKNRLGLAQWLLSDENPLTARVFVNRIWQEIFGRGIVATPGDFGMQGELPSNIELLDYLANDFKNSDWDIKRLVKKIVLSATYRQSSEVSDKHLRLDPDNIYLARSPRFRIPAELVRDMVLYSSGLLNETIGGPSVKTYQPDGIWEVTTSGRGLLANYIQDKGDDLYRRGMYQFIKRTVPPPVMLMFDASNRDQCEVKRLNTNTPLQALIMLNDPHVLEASRVLAEHLVAREEMEIKDKIENAFSRIVCRPIQKNEITLFENYYQEELANFQSFPEDAELLLSSGEYPRNIDLDSASTAALMQVVHLMYNMEETLTKT